MRTHQEIDQRSLALAQAVVEKLEAGNLSDGLDHVRAVNRRWRQQNPSTLHDEWARILSGDWPSIRATLLDDSERGAQLRQNSPFCGILTPRERWRFFKEYQSHEA